MFKLLFPDISDNLKIFDKVAQITITAKLIKPDCVHSPVCWGQSPAIFRLDCTLRELHGRQLIGRTGVFRTD